jgi:hypothetical protein
LSLIHFYCISISGLFGIAAVTVACFLLSEWYKELGTQKKDAHQDNPYLKNWKRYFIQQCVNCNTETEEI